MHCIGEYRNKAELLSAVYTQSHDYWLDSTKSTKYYLDKQTD